MTEIPKDGKSYLAWHKIYGHVFICYVEGLDGYWKVNDLVCFFYNDLERWMDEKGQWHEVQDYRLESVLEVNKILREGISD